MIWLGFSIIFASLIVYVGLDNIAVALSIKKNEKIIEKRGK